MRHRKIILGGLWLFILVVLVAFRAVVLPFAAAALVAYLVAPLVNRMAQLKIAGHSFPRWSAILVIYAVFFVGVYLLLFLLVPQIYRELARISRGVEVT